EFQSHWGANTGVSIPPPRFGAWVLKGTIAWYYALTAIGGLVLVLSVNLQRSRAGRAWMAIRDREIAAESVGIDVARYKVLAFVWSSALTSVAGALFAYQRAFVSVEAFGFFLAIEYIAMVIIGGLGSALGAVLGAAFVTLLPYGIDAGVAALRVPAGAIVALLGTNGAGKTTTLRAISGFLGADDAQIVGGRVLFQGATVTGRPPHELVGRGLVLVPERDKVFETLTVQENLRALVPGWRAWRGADRPRIRLDQVFEYFPLLADRRRQLAGYLSGGERQMLALATALLC